MLRNAVPFAIQRVEWTPDRVQCFWDYYNSKPSMREKYFTRWLSKSICRQAARFFPLDQCRVVDLGCGDGHLIDELVRHGANTVGIDSSAESIRSVSARISSKHLVGAYTDASMLTSGSYDAVFLIETIEHLEDPQLHEVLSSIRRILRPGGYIFLTTPNDEDLSAQMTLCPCCNAEFHIVQHVRSWNGDSLSYLMRNEGFMESFCDAVVLLPSHPLRALAEWARYCSFLPRSMARRLGFKEKLPNLIYVGRLA